MNNTKLTAFYDEITQIEKTAGGLKSFWGLLSGRTTKAARENLGLSKAEYKQLRANRDAKAKALKAGQDSVKPGGMKNFNQKLKEFFGSAESSTGGLSKKLDAEAALRKAERGQLQARLLVGSGLLGGGLVAYSVLRKKRKK